MAKLNLNILANFSGQVWSMGLSLVFTPIYIHALGVESYGLIGVYLLLLGLVQMFDFGLGATLNRELSRRFYLPENRRELKTLVKTAEFVYATLVILMVGGLMLGAGLLAGSWINVTESSRENVKYLVMLMSILLGLQWPLGLYQNILMGMHEQPTANLANASYATFANLGAALLILGTHSGVEAFFISMAVVSFFQLIHFRILCWRKLGPGGDPGVINIHVLRNSIGF